MFFATRLGETVNATGGSGFDAFRLIWLPGAGLEAEDDES